MSKDNLIAFFDDLLLNKEKWTNSTDGAGFEDILITRLKAHGFDRSIPENDEVVREYLKKIKPDVLDVVNMRVLDNELQDRGNEYRNFFIHQPFGSQQFPDFLIFTDTKIFAVESKYSKQTGSKPTWNSNLPKSSGIYIFGSHGKRDITFFIGEDILPQNERIILYEFFENTTRKVMEDFQKELNEKYDAKEMSFSRGFNVYIRKAYEQNQNINKEAELDYFKASERQQNELNVKKFIADSIEEKLTA